MNRAYLKAEEKQINRLKDILFPKQKIVNYSTKNKEDKEQYIKFYGEEQNNHNKHKSYKVSTLQVNASSVQYTTPIDQSYDEEYEQKKLIKKQLDKLKEQICGMLKKCPNNQSTNSWLYQPQRLQSQYNTQQSQEQDQVSHTQRHYLCSINKLNQALQKYNQYSFGIRQAAQQLCDNMQVQHFYSKSKLQLKNRGKYYLTLMICNFINYKIQTIRKQRVQYAFTKIDNYSNLKKQQQKQHKSAASLLKQKYEKNMMKLLQKGFSKWRQTTSILEYQENQQLKRQKEMPWRNQSQNFIPKNILFLQKLVLYFQAKLNQNHFKCEVLLYGKSQDKFSQSQSQKAFQILTGYIYSEGEEFVSSPQQLYKNYNQNVLQSISARSAQSNFAYSNCVKKYEIPLKPQANSLTKFALNNKKIIKIQKFIQNNLFSSIDRSITSQIQYKLANTERQIQQNIQTKNILDCVSQSAGIFYPLLIQNKVIGVIRQYFQTNAYSSTKQINQQSLLFISQTLNNSITLLQKLKQMKVQKHFLQQKYNLKGIKLIQSLQVSKYQDLFEVLSENLQQFLHFSYFSHFILQKRKDCKNNSKVSLNFLENQITLKLQKQNNRIACSQSLSQKIQAKILLAVQKMKNKDISHMLMIQNQVSDIEQIQKQKGYLFIKIDSNFYCFTIQQSATTQKLNTEAQLKKKDLPYQILTDLLLKYQQIQQIKKRQFMKQEQKIMHGLKINYENKTNFISEKMNKQFIQIFSRRGQSQQQSKNMLQNQNICTQIHKLFKVFYKSIESITGSSEHISNNYSNLYSFPIQIAVKNNPNSKCSSSISNLYVKVSIKPSSYQILSINFQEDSKADSQKTYQMLYSSNKSQLKINSLETTIIEISCQKQSIQKLLNSITYEGEQNIQIQNKNNIQSYQNEIKKMESRNIYNIFVQMFSKYFDSYFQADSQKESNTKKLRLDLNLSQNEFKINKDSTKIQTLEGLKQIIIRMSHQLLNSLSKNNLETTQKNVQFLAKDLNSMMNLSKKQTSSLNENDNNGTKHISMNFYPTLSFSRPQMEKIIFQIGLKDQILKCLQPKQQQNNKNQSVLLVNYKKRPLLKIVLPYNLLNIQLDHQICVQFIKIVNQIIVKFQQNKHTQHKINLLDRLTKINLFCISKHNQTYRVAFSSIKCKSKQIMVKINRLNNMNNLLSKFNARVQSKTISYWKKQTSITLFQEKSQMIHKKQLNPEGYTFENIKILINSVFKLNCKKINQLFLIYKKSTKGKFRFLLDQKLFQVYENRVKIFIMHGLKMIKLQAKQKLRVCLFQKKKTQAKTFIFMQILQKIFNQKNISIFNHVKSRKQMIKQQQKQILYQNSHSIEYFQFCLNKCKNISEVERYLNTVSDLSNIQIWMKIGKKNEYYLNFKNNQYLQSLLRQKTQTKTQLGNSENSRTIFSSTNTWLTLKKEQLLNITEQKQKYIIYQSPSQTIFVILKQNYDSFGFKQKQYLNQLSKTFRQYFTHLKHNIKCKISLNQEIIRSLNKIALKQSLKNWRNILQTDIRTQKYQINDRIYEVCAQMQNIKQKIKFQQKQKEQISKQHKKLSQKQQQLNLRIQKYSTHINSIQACIDQHKQQTFQLSQQRKIILKQSLLKWRQVNLIDKIHETKERNLMKCIKLLHRVVQRIYKSQQKKTLRQSLNKICGFVMHLRQEQEKNQKSLASQLQESYQELNTRLMTFQKNNFNSSIQQNDEEQQSNYRQFDDKQSWYEEPQQNQIKLRTALFQGQNCSLNQYDQSQNPYFSSKQNEHTDNYKQNDLTQDLKASQSYRKNGMCLQIPMAINRLKMNEPSLNKENVDVSIEEENRINRGVYKLNGKTLRFLKRMGKINE